MTHPSTPQTDPPRDERWRDEALCAQVGQELFFPEQGESIGPAKRICGSCPVHVDCLDYALAHDQRYGVWGGLSERERRTLQRIRQVG